jgi:hypothetical protein
VILHPGTDNAITGWIANHVFRIAEGTTPEPEPCPDFEILFAAIQLRIDGIRAELDKIAEILDDVA